MLFSAPASVVSRSQGVPETPVKGPRYIVPSGADGPWANHDNKITWFDGNQWKFSVPSHGTSIWIDDENTPAVWSDPVWETIKYSSLNAAPITSPDFKGDPKAPTAPADDSSQSIANTAWTKALFLAEQSSRISADAALAQDFADALTAEASSRDAAISSAVAVETSARIAADNTEITARNAAISSAVAAEASSRDAAISSAVAVETSARIAADNLLAPKNNPTFTGTVITSSVDSVDDGTLNLGSVNAATVNLGTATSTQVVNIGTGSGVTTINIGGAGDTVTISGTLQSINTTNTNVLDSLLTLNKGGAAGSGNASGIAIEEGGSVTGYAETGNSRSSWTFKAPGKSGTVLLTPGAGAFSSEIISSATANRQFTLPDATGTLALVSNIPTTTSDLTNDSGYITGISATNVFNAISVQNNPDWYRTSGQTGILFASYAAGFYSTSSQLIQTYNSSSLQVNGNIYATGNITAYYSSDRRLKENITPISDALTKVCSVSGVEFDWTDAYLKNQVLQNNSYFCQKHDVGVIAQEIQAVLPEVVAEREDGTLAVKYDRIVALLIEAVKDLKAEVDALKAK